MSHYSEQEVRTLLEEARTAYERGEVAQAASLYRKLVERGHGGPDVEYNLGTAELAAGHGGKAILHLERARREGGANRDVDAQLARARATLGERAVVGQAAEGPWRRIASTGLARRSPEIFFSALVVLFVALAARRLRPSFRRVAPLALMVALPAALLALTPLVAARYDRQAIVVAEPAIVRAANALDGPVVTDVAAGVKVRLLESRDEQVRIRLPDGREGWLPSASLHPLEQERSRS